MPLVPAAFSLTRMHPVVVAAGGSGRSCLPHHWWLKKALLSKPAASCSCEPGQLMHSKCCMSAVRLLSHTLLTALALLGPTFAA